MYLVIAVRGYQLFAAVIAAIVVAVAAPMVMAVVIGVVDVTAAVVGVGPVIPHGFVPSSNGPTCILQRLEAFLHALRKR